jgi:hypothetical protein
MHYIYRYTYISYNLVLDSSEEEPAQGPHAAAAVPEAGEAEGGGAVHPAGPDRPQGGGQGAAHGGPHRPAAALVRGEDEPGQSRPGRQDAERRVPAFLLCTLTGTSRPPRQQSCASNPLLFFSLLFAPC